MNQVEDECDRQVARAKRVAEADQVQERCPTCGERIEDSTDYHPHPGVCLVADPDDPILHTQPFPEPNPPGLVKTPAGESSRPSTPPPAGRAGTERRWTVFASHASGGAMLKGPSIEDGTVVVEEAAALARASAVEQERDALQFNAVTKDDLAAKQAEWDAQAERVNGRAEAAEQRVRELEGAIRDFYRAAVAARDYTLEGLKARNKLYELARSLLPGTLHS